MLASSHLTLRLFFFDKVLQWNGQPLLVCMIAGLTITHLDAWISSRLDEGAQKTPPRRALWNVVPRESRWRKWGLWFGGDNETERITFFVFIVAWVLNPRDTYIR